MQGDLGRIAERLAFRQELTPFAGEGGVEHVEETVDGEEPTEGEVEGHAPRQAALQAERFVDVGRPELEVEVTDADGERITQIRPVDPHAAPDHHCQQREVDPMHPPGGPMVHQTRPPFAGVRWSAHLCVLNGPRWSVCLKKCHDFLSPCLYMVR